MKVIANTSVWSLTLGGKKKQVRNEIRILESLINGQNICMLGPIRQEILSGIKDNKQFEKLRDYLRLSMTIKFL